MKKRLVKAAALTFAISAAFSVTAMAGPIVSTKNLVIINGGTSRRRNHRPPSSGCPVVVCFTNSDGSQNDPDRDLGYSFRRNGHRPQGS